MVDNKNRPSHYSGTLKFDVPGYDDVEYGYGTGGSGRGSVPYGSYPISTYYHRTPKGLQGWAVNTPDGRIADPKYSSPRTSIMIHPDQLSDADRIITAGCIGIAKNQWADFKAALKEVTQKFGGAIIDVSATGNAIIRLPGTAASAELASGPNEIISNFGTLKVGAQNNPARVKALQETLAKAGLYNGPIDGVYGKGTAKAVKQQQAAMNEQLSGFGLKPMAVDGKWGSQTTAAAAALGYTEAEPGPQAAALARYKGMQPDPSVPSFSEAMAARNAAMGAPKVEDPPSPLQGAPTIPVERRALPDLVPRLTGASVQVDPGSAEASVRMAPVRPGSMPGTTISDFDPAKAGQALRGPKATATTYSDWAAKSASALGDIANRQAIADRRDLEQPATVNRAAQAEALRQDAIRRTANDPRFNSALLGNGLRGSPEAQPSMRYNAPQGGGLLASTEARPSRRADLTGSGSPLEVALSSDRPVPQRGTPMTPSGIPRKGWHTAAVINAPQSQPIPGRSVQTTSIPQNVQISAGASARPTVDPGAMSRTFDIMNYAPTVGAKVASAPKPTTPAPGAGPITGSMRGGYNPAALASFGRATPGYPSPSPAPAPSPALTGPLAGAAARFAGVQAQQAAPVYKPVSPIAAAPIKPSVAPVAGAPVAAAATAAPMGPLGKLAPGILGMAMAGGPLGVLGGFAKLAKASLGNVNNPKGMGFSQATLDANNRFTPSPSDDIDGKPGGASYGRKTSDGVRGTTSSGTRYTSRDGGRDIEIGGRSYSTNRRGTYSLNVGRR